MGIVADRLKSLCIELPSPDGRIAGTFRPPEELSVRFRDGGLRHYTERGLELQLAGLIEKLWTENRRARLAAVAEATGRPAVPFKPWRAEGRRFEAERDATVVEGMSTGRRVYVSSTGLRGWNVVLRDGSVAALAETELAAEVKSGYTAMRRDWHQKLNRLRAKHFPH